MWIFLALISICRRAHVFCFILLIPVNLQQYRGEIGASYNRSCKYTFVGYSSKFNNILMCLLLRLFSWLAFYVVIFVKGLKNCTNCIIKLSIISLHLLVSYSFLTQLWIYSYRISLSGDIELNPGPKWDVNQYFSVCHWNLNIVASHKSAFSIFSGRIFQTFTPRFKTVSLPYLHDLIICLSVQLFFLKSYEWSLNFKISVIISGANPLFTLNISVNSTWMFLSWIVTDLCFREVPEKKNFYRYKQVSKHVLASCLLIVNLSTTTHPDEWTVAELLH